MQIILYTKSQIRDLLHQNDRAVEKAVLTIQKRQTQAEQLTGETRVTNGRGWNLFHAKSGAYWARWIAAGNRLSGEHLTRARQTVMKYAGQLTEVANEKQIEKARMMAVKARQT